MCVCVCVLMLVLLPHRMSSSNASEGQSSILPPVNVTIIVEGKLTGHIKRRYHDQALKKLIPLLQKFSSKQPCEVLVVDLKADHLSALAAESNVSVFTDSKIANSGFSYSLFDQYCG